MSRSSITQTVLIALQLLSAAFVLCKPPDSDKPAGEHVHGREKIGDTEHYVDGEHNPKYDRQVLLGEDEATEFDKLSLEERKERLKIVFHKIDKDEDGLLTREEVKNWVNHVHSRNHRIDTEKHWNKHERADKDKLRWSEFLALGYGVSSETELQERRDFTDTFRRRLLREKRRWMVADKNKDKILTLAEYYDFLHPEDSNDTKHVYVEEQFEFMDQNRDGMVTVQEYIDNMYLPDSKTKDAEEPDWVKDQREQFDQYFDKNKDGKMDKQEVKLMVFPENYDRGDAEAAHLIYHADTDKDEKLSEEEVMKKYDIFENSHVVDFGKVLVHHDEF